MGLLSAKDQPELRDAGEREPSMLQLEAPMSMEEIESQRQEALSLLRP